MSWIKSTEALPPAGSEVKMKWDDRGKEWYGDPVTVLRDVRKQYYGKLLWWRESPTTADASVLKEAEMNAALGTIANSYKTKEFVDGFKNGWKERSYLAQSPSSIEESGLKEGEDKFWDDFAIEYEALQRMEENTWEWNRSILKEKYRISKI